MKQEFKQQIKKELQQRMADKQLSQNKAADLIDISPAMLSLILNDEFDKIGERTWRKLANWMNLREESGWRIRETKNLHIIHNLCIDAQENHRTLGLIGYTGAGKTTGLKYYAQRTRDCFYVLCQTGMGRKEFLNSIMRAMGIYEEGSVSFKIQRIVDDLLDRSFPLLILDSAHRVPDSVFEIIQQLMESLEYKAGIIISGTEHLYSYVAKMSAKNKRGFRELFRRVAYWENMRTVTGAFIATVASEFNIKSDEAIKFIARKCNDYGTVRELMTAFSRAKQDGQSELQILTSLNVGAMEAHAV